MSATVHSGVSPARAADFAALRDLTLALRACVEAGEWLDCAELESRRRAVIERVFDEPPSAAELPSLTETLREVVRVNEEMLGLAAHRRRTLEREVDTVARGRVAVDAYAAAGRPHAYAE